MRVKLIVETILSLFIVIVIKMEFGGVIGSVFNIAIASTIATSSSNQFAGAEITVIKLISLMLVFFGSFGIIITVENFLKRLVN